MTTSDTISKVEKNMINFARAINRPMLYLKLLFCVLLFIGGILLVFKRAVYVVKTSGTVTGERKGTHITVMPAGSSCAAIPIETSSEKTEYGKGATVKFYKSKSDKNGCPKTGQIQSDYSMRLLGVGAIVVALLAAAVSYIWFRMVKESNLAAGIETVDFVTSLF